MNDKSKTYIYPATGATSAVDLTLSDPSLFLDLIWQVADDLCGSDHFPIIIKGVHSQQDQRTPKWQLHRADWTKFKELCEDYLTLETFDDSCDPMDLFTSRLFGIAEQCIPKSSTRPRKIHYPWFTDDCKKAINARKKALKAFSKNSNQENLLCYKKAAATARHTIKQAKRHSWRQYISKLNSRTPTRKTWEIVRKICGKYASYPLKFLETTNKIAKTPKEISDTLGQTFQNHSSSQNYSTEFQKFKEIQEKSNLNFESQNYEDYNSDFSMRELEECLFNAKDSASGPDEIHYQMLKHLPLSSKELLLSIFNNIYNTGYFPQQWRDAIIIPIHKSGKDSTKPENYRPIALTSCICKTMERLVNTRLVWYLEANGLITKYQAGFRKTRSTEDQLV